MIKALLAFTLATSFVASFSAQAQSNNTLQEKVNVALEGLKNYSLDVMGASPYEFFHARAEYVEIDAGSSTCQPGVVAYVRNSTTKTLYVCPYAENLTVLALQSNLLHEARHLDGPEYVPGEFTPEHPDEETAYPHVLCKQGVFKDYEACDETLEGGGSYTVQTQFFLKVAEAENLSEALRQEARGMAVTYLLDHFNQMPLGITQGALLLSLDRTLSFYDGSDNPLTEILRNIPSESIVALRSLPTLLNPLDVSVRSYIGPETFMETPGAFSKKFREGLTNEERGRLLDVYYGGMQACFLFTDSVYCEIAGRSQSLPLPADIKAVHFNIMNLFGSDMVLVVSENGDFYSIPFHKPIGEWTTEMMEKNKTLSGFRSVAMMPGYFNVAITLDGILVRFDKIVEPQAVDFLKDQRFEKCLSPVLWSPRFKDI